MRKTQNFGIKSSLCSLVAGAAVGVATMLGSGCSENKTYILPAENADNGSSPTNPTNTANPVTPTADLVFGRFVMDTQRGAVLQKTGDDNNGDISFYDRFDGSTRDLANVDPFTYMSPSGVMGGALDETIAVEVHNYQPGHSDADFSAIETATGREVFRSNTPSVHEHIVSTLPDGVAINLEDQSRNRAARYVLDTNTLEKIDPNAIASQVLSVGNTNLDLGEKILTLETPTGTSVYSFENGVRSPKMVFEGLDIVEGRDEIQWRASSKDRLVYNEFGDSTFKAVWSNQGPRPDKANLHLPDSLGNGYFLGWSDEQNGLQTAYAIERDAQGLGEKLVSFGIPTGAYGQFGQFDCYGGYVDLNQAVSNVRQIDVSPGAIGSRVTSIQTYIDDGTGNFTEKTLLHSHIYGSVVDAFGPNTRSQVKMAKNGYSLVSVRDITVAPGKGSIEQIIAVDGHAWDASSAVQQLSTPYTQRQIVSGYEPKGDLAAICGELPLQNRTQFDLMIYDFNTGSEDFVSNDYTGSSWRSCHISDNGMVHYLTRQNGKVQLNKWDGKNKRNVAANIIEFDNMEIVGASNDGARAYVKTIGGQLLEVNTLPPATSHRVCYSNQ